MPTRLIELVKNLPRSKVVLIGDLMVDRYLYGSADRLSPEAPVPVLHFERQELRLGGAASVAADLAGISPSAWISWLGPELVILWPSRAANSPAAAPACQAGDVGHGRALHGSAVKQAE